MLLLIVLIVLVLLFGGLGFTVHLLWIVALIALAVLVIHALTR